MKIEASLATPFSAPSLSLTHTQFPVFVFFLINEF